jgi:hypothetical protein
VVADSPHLQAAPVIGFVSKTVHAVVVAAAALGPSAHVLSAWQYLPTWHSSLVALAAHLQSLVRMRESLVMQSTGFASALQVLSAQQYLLTAHSSVVAASLHLHLLAIAVVSLYEQGEVEAVAVFAPALQVSSVQQYLPLAHWFVVESLAHLHSATRTRPSSAVQSVTPGGGGEGFGDGLVLVASVVSSTLAASWHVLSLWQNFPTAQSFVVEVVTHLHALSVMATLSLIVHAVTAAPPVAFAAALHVLSA